jgi:hypothetical protein
LAHDVFISYTSAEKSAADAVCHRLEEAGIRIENSLSTGAFRLHLNRLHWLDALSPPLDAHIDRLIETAKPNLPEAGEGEAEEARPPQQKEKEEEKKKKKKGEKEKGRRHRWPAAVAPAAGLAAAAKSVITLS